MSNLDLKINNLLPGQSMIVSSYNKNFCNVERTGDGKTLRFIRTFENVRMKCIELLLFILFELNLLKRVSCFLALSKFIKCFAIS